MGYVVRHKTFGVGTVKRIKGDFIEIDFNGAIKSFQFPKAFEAFLSTDDKELLNKISAKAKEKGSEDKTSVSDGSRISIGSPKHAVPEHSFSHELVGDRAKNIEFASLEELFEIVGYMASPGRIKAIEAEVPKDGRDKTFENMFPGQTYRPIETGDTPSGLPNKLGPQFRINFANIDNCPMALKVHLGKGNASCVARINRSRFVIDMVQNYGFRFGTKQDASRVKEIALKKGCLDSFEKGYRR